jgi:hypothetical protein
MMNQMLAFAHPALLAGAAKTDRHMMDQRQLSSYLLIVVALVASSMKAKRTNSL